MEKVGSNIILEVGSKICRLPAYIETLVLYVSFMLMAVRIHLTCIYSIISYPSFS